MDAALEEGRRADREYGARSKERSADCRVLDHDSAVTRPAVMPVLGEVEAEPSE